MSIPKQFHYALNKAQEEVIKRWMDALLVEPYIQYYGNGLYKVTASKDMVYYTGKLGAEQASDALKTAIKDLTK